MSHGAAVLVGGGGTTDPVLGAICQAQAINAASGGPVIAPWQVDELPDEWLDAFGILEEKDRRKRAISQDRKNV